MKRRDARPRQEAPIGSTWELNVGGEGKYTGIVVVIGELRRSSGNYPCVMLACSGSWTTRPGQKMNAAVTTARWWRRLT